MNPLELEIYKHIKYDIGIDPNLYEYILMVDADTEVYPESLNRMVAYMVRDSKVTYFYCMKDCGFVWVF